jgi:hypothetical protein
METIQTQCGYSLIVLITDCVKADLLKADLLKLLKGSIILFIHEQSKQSKLHIPNEYKRRKGTHTSVTDSFDVGIGRRKEQEN